MSTWFYIGIALLLWVGYDFFYGKTWIHRPVYRADEPGLYWITTVVWLVLAVSAIFAGL